MELAKQLRNIVLRGLVIGLFLIVAGWLLTAGAGWLSRLAWGANSGGAALSASIIFYVCAIGISIGGLLSMNIKTASEYVKQENPGADTRSLHRLLIVKLEQYIQMMIGIFILALFLFWHSTVLWQAVQAGLFKSGPLPSWDVFTFGVDLTMKGVMFDLLEHYNVDFTRAQLNYSNHLYVLYSLSYRLYVSLIFLGTTWKGMTLYASVRDNPGGGTPDQSPA